MNKFFLSMVLSAVVLGGCGWWWIDFRGRVLVAGALQKEEQLVVDFIREEVKATTTAEDFLSGDTARHDAVFSRMWRSIQSPEYLRIKVWDDNYTLIWADLKESIGSRYPDNRELSEAVEGEVEVELVMSGSAENETERQLSQAVEVYVPIVGSDGETVVGVVETYKTSRLLSDAVLESKKNAYRTAILLLVFYGVLAIVFRRLFSTKAAVAIPMSESPVA